jgi:hypothetical protein
MFLAKNTKPKNRFSGCPKTGFSVLKNLRVTRFFGFGKTSMSRNRHSCFLVANQLLPGKQNVYFRKMPGVGNQAAQGPSRPNSVTEYDILNI